MIKRIALLIIALLTVKSVNAQTAADSTSKPPPDTVKKSPLKTLSYKPGLVMKFHHSWLQKCSS